MDDIILTCLLKKKKKRKMGIKVFPGASPSAQAGGQLQETGLQTK